MVVASCWPLLGVLGNWDFSNFPASTWAQIIAFESLSCRRSGTSSSRIAKSRGINVDYAFKEIPPDKIVSIRQFFSQQ